MQNSVSVKPFKLIFTCDDEDERLTVVEIATAITAVATAVTAIIALAKEIREGKKDGQNKQQD